MPWHDYFDTEAEKKKNREMSKVPTQYMYAQRRCNDRPQSCEMPSFAGAHEYTPRQSLTARAKIYGFFACYNTIQDKR